MQQRLLRLREIACLAEGCVNVDRNKHPGMDLEGTLKLTHSIADCRSHGESDRYCKPERSNARRSVPSCFAASMNSVTRARAAG